MLLDLQSKLNKIEFMAKEFVQFKAYGSLTRAVGLTVECQGIRAPLGTVCEIVISKNNIVQAVVTGFQGNKIYLMPLSSIEHLEPGTKIISTQKKIQIPVGFDLLGRVLNSEGCFLDNLEEPEINEFRPLHTKPDNPLERVPVTKPLDVGVKAINGLLSIGIGQRIGLFAGSGVGKSVLLGMIAKFTSADIVVIGLIGERSREVREFIEFNLGSEGLKKSVVVASPASYSPMQRIHGALGAMSIAEIYRDQGKDVLLLMDSLTRYAQAQREISLAMGEPPATRGYPPSSFAILPQLVERAGTSETTSGSITGIFTVLAEGDDEQDPIVDAARAILDGHIFLSRELAEQGHYPAISIESSISRVMTNVASKHHLMVAQKFKKLYSLYEQNKDLIKIGAYSQGIDPELDLAVRCINDMKEFLMQDMNTPESFDNTIKNLEISLAKNMQHMQPSDEVG